MVTTLETGQKLEVRKISLEQLGEMVGGRDLCSNQWLKQVPSGKRNLY